jgi:hypothetical protein
MQENQDQFILPEYLPNGCTLTQCHHMHKEDVNAVLKHWTDRQAAGEIPFRFKNNPMANKRGKQSSADVNTPTPADPTEKSEEDRRDAGSNQEQGSDGEDQGGGEGVAGNVRLLPIHGL